MKRLLILLCFFATSAVAIDNGRWKDVDPLTRNWFKSIRSPQGVPCCDTADGHLTEWDMKENHYWVPIEGKWHEVPPEAVVRNVGNPFGKAVVWYVIQGSVNGEYIYHIRCFVPANEV